MTYSTSLVFLEIELAEVSVVLSVVIQAVPGREEELLSQLPALLGPTRAEVGCEAYEQHRDISDSAKFLFYERFKDEKALDEHVNSPYFQAFVAIRAEGEDPVASQTITRWSLIL